MTGLRRFGAAGASLARAIGRWSSCARAVLQILQDGELQLLWIGHTLQPRDFGGQLQRLRNEPLIFAIEEETDLTERFKIVFLTQLHHASCI